MFPEIVSGSHMLHLFNKNGHFCFPASQVVCYGFLSGADPVPTRAKPMPTIKLGKRALDNLPKVTKRTTFYDTDLTGFGLRISQSGARSWIVEYRPGPRGRGVSTRRMVIGTPKTLTPDQARTQASALLASVKLGTDPASERMALRQAETVGEVLSAFMDKVRSLQKASTAALYRSYINRHLVPAFGNKKAIALRHDEVIRFHRLIGKDHPATANRLITVLSAAYTYAIKSHILPKGTPNPAAGVEKFREQHRERFLTESELLRLGDAIREAETRGIVWSDGDLTNPRAKHAPSKPENRVTIIGPHAAAALRLLVFTGTRLREILHLRWDHVDLQRGLLFLPDSKTGKKTIVLGGAALAILTNLEHVGRYVVAGNDPEKPRADLQRPWALVSRRAGLDGLRLHDLRHSFASVGAGSGLGLPIIGKLLGHSSSKTTERYAHLAADPVRRAADAVSGTIAKAMGEFPLGDPVEVGTIRARVA
jgi:integrase